MVKIDAFSNKMKLITKLALIFIFTVVYFSANLNFGYAQERLQQEKDYKIAVAGLGYVGLSNAILLSQNNQVYGVDVDKNKLNMINNKVSPLAEDLISDYLKDKELKLDCTVSAEFAYKNADFLIIATPTDYNAETNFFNTSLVESVIEQAININPEITIVIKSTIPVGFTESMKKKYNFENILFSSEFLREGKALYDCLNPSRIIVSVPKNSKEGLIEKANVFANLLKNSAQKTDINILIMDSTEAEAVKLFSNGYLAMRVAFFNELDTYADVNNLDTKQIIDGVSLDPRIGNFYNNPSFGYGGYCFPKDTKQLKAQFENIPNDIIQAIVFSNETRKQFIVDEILKQSPKSVGVFRLTMKSGSDNFRSSAIQDIMKKLANSGIEIFIYEPIVKTDTYENFKVINDLEEFKNKSDIILTNRNSDDLNNVMEKVYTRDLYTRD